MSHDEQRNASFNNVLILVTYKMFILFPSATNWSVQSCQSQATKTGLSSDLQMLLSGSERAHNQLFKYDSSPVL